MLHTMFPRGIITQSQSGVDKERLELRPGKSPALGFVQRCFNLSQDVYSIFHKERETNDMFLTCFIYVYTDYFLYLMCDW